MPLSVGDIVHVYVPSLQHPKEKLAVGACLEPKALVFLISSELTAFKRSRPAILARQLRMEAGSHSCLGYDSWLDCTEPHSLPALVADCATDPGRIVGRISGELRHEIVKAVASSPGSLVARYQAHPGRARRVDWQPMKTQAVANLRWQRITVADDGYDIPARIPRAGAVSTMVV